MNNVDEVRKELILIFQNLKDRKISGKDAKEMNNCAGKIINTLRVELEYAALSNTVPTIPFLHYEKVTEK